MTDWTCDANQALSISLVRSPADEEALAEEESYSNFRPRFTYPIFGEDEKIYGYRGLTIDLQFASGSLVQYLSVSHSNRLGSAAAVDDVEGTLGNFISSDYYKDRQEFLARVEEDATSFQPPGEMISSYTRPSPIPRANGNGIAKSPESPAESEDITFEVYHATWDTPGLREYHRRMQIFILFYIEAGSYINEEEEPWEFFILYEKRKRRQSPHTATYHFVGYSSLYNFYCFPERVRMRLSQFVILPPYQKHGHGSELYKAIYHYVLSRPGVAELTVEDPAEAFEDLRDKNDLNMLLSNEQFMEEGFGEGSISYGGGKVSKKSGKAKRQATRRKLDPPANKAWLEKWRINLKIAGRQFHRLVEMLILFKLDPSDESAIRAYRLQVKERLYRFNYEVLVQLDKQERLEKLEETFQSVREDYLRILSKIR